METLKARVHIYLKKVGWHAIHEWLQLCSDSLPASSFPLKLHSRLAVMADTRLTPQFMIEFEQVLTSKKPANEALQACMDILHKHKLSYKLEKVHCKYFLVHILNRGGLMLSPHNVHRNAVKIYKVGADLKQLTNGLAIELAPSGAQRDLNIQANNMLVKRSQGLLAKVSGDERYLTLGCGHTAAFCKTADLCGKTNQADIMDDEGNIAIYKVKKNPNFKAMIECGWDWDIVPHEVDTAFPQFAKIAQKALNTSNHVATQVGELEAAVTLADYMDDNILSANADGSKPVSSKWEEAAIASLVDLCVPCSSYAAVLKDFVKNYGGGSGAPLVRFMDTVAKQFQCNVSLGETFWHAVTYASLGDKLNSMPLTRVALLLCNLSSDKVEDGIAKRLIPKDITKLTGKKYKAEVEDLESTLKHAMLISDAIVKPSGKSKDEFMQPLGQIFVRGGLLLTEKGMRGSDGKPFSLPQIKQMYLDDIGNKAGTALRYKDWDTAAVEEKPIEQKAPDDANSNAKSNVMPNLEDLSNPMWIAKQNGFEVGQRVAQKAGKKGKTFQIMSIGSTVSLKLVGSLTNESFEGDIELSELLNEWSQDRTSLPEKSVVQQQMSASQVQTTFSKTLLWQALAEAHTKSLKEFKKGLEKICFWHKPDQLRTNSSSVHAKELCFFPMAPFSSISNSGCGTNSACLGKHNATPGDCDDFVVNRPQPTKLKADGSVPDASWVIAFWWVMTTPNKAEANMELSSQLVKGIRLPCLVNPKGIPPFTRLVRFVKAPEPTCTVAFGDAAEPQAKKKMRKSR